MTLLYVLGALSVAFSIGSGYCAITDKHALRLVFKTVASIFFIFTGLWAIKFVGAADTYAVCVMAALVFGMLGDIFLCMDGLDNKKSALILNGLGVLTFLIGHIFFIYIFLSSASFTYWTIALVPIIPIALLITMRAKVVNIPKIAPVFIVYSLILGMMLMSSVSFYLAIGGIKGKLILTAGVLFAASDSSLVMREYSIFKSIKKPLKFFVLITYYVAQVLFALSIVF